LSTIEDLLKARYYQPSEGSWEDVCKRVSSFLMPAPWLRAHLMNDMLNKRFLPSTPVLANAGTRVPMMCSCFVIPVEDSIAGIMQSLTDTMMIQKYGGGVGLDFSPIRCDGSRVNSTNGIASGPVSFMEFWNSGMNVIKQGGKRQGALMGVLNVHHPDLLKFINAKEKEGRLTNFNISVSLDASFFKDIEDMNTTVYPCGHTAQYILNFLVKNTWRNGEPGVLFLDNINKDSPYKEPIYTTNPCGEVPLPAYGACCLGSINLNHALNKDEKGWSFSRDKLNMLVSTGITTLNAVIDKTWWPLEKIEEFENANRPIGLGVMGLADMLAKLGLPYWGDGFVKKLFATMREMAEHWASHYSQETGKPRNKTVLSIAPTGSIAMLADASYSVEPYFSLAYVKKVNAGEFKGKVEVLNEVLGDSGICDLDAINQEVVNTGSVQNTNLPADLKYVFRTAQEIPYSQHLQVQADVQFSVDNAVSKTINLPKATTEAEIASIILTAHKLGIKGLTMYRAGSREVEVMGCPTGTCSI
jgi:ribonucleoside-diphosphate reductase alpha chain